MPFHYHTILSRKVRCKNGVRLRVEFQQEMSRGHISWRKDIRSREIAFTVQTIFGDCGSKVPGQNTYLIVTSDTKGGLAIAVTAKNTHIDVKNLLVVQEFLAQFVDECDYDLSE